MRDVAKEAGVAVETLYSHFSSKRRLLDAVIDTTIVADDEPIAVAERPEFAALGIGARAERVVAAASLVTVLHERTLAFAKLLREAAWGDPEIAEVLRATRERQRVDVARGIALMLGRAPTDIERDGVWALLSPEVYLLLVEESGWSTDQYERWIAESLERVLPPG
jgi:AcrR family transcriptional regulator